MFNTWNYEENRNNLSFEEKIDREVADWKKIGYDIEDCDFTKWEKIHNWRNHVDGDIREYWKELTDRERKLIFIKAAIEAQEEDWD